MANLSSITTTIGEAGASLNEFIADNKNTLIGVGAGVVGGAIIVGSGVAISRAKSSKKKKTGSKYKRKTTGRARDRRFISKQKHEVAYQRRRKKQGKKTYGKHYKKRSSKPKRLVKGSKEAKAYMKKLRNMRK